MNKKLATAASDEASQVQVRRDKLTSLREEGIAFPNKFRRNVVAACLHAKYADFAKEKLEAISETYPVLRLRPHLQESRFGHKNSSREY